MNSEIASSRSPGDNEPVAARVVDVANVNGAGERARRQSRWRSPFVPAARNPPDPARPLTNPRPTRWPPRSHRCGRTVAASARFVKPHKVVGRAIEHVLCLSLAGGSVCAPQDTWSVSGSKNRRCGGTAKGANVFPDAPNTPAQKLSRPSVDEHHEVAVRRVATGGQLGEIRN